MQDARQAFDKILEICGKRCFDIVSLTCFTAAMLLAVIMGRFYLSDEARLAQRSCVAAWMFTMTISIILICRPRIRNHKIKTCRLAIAYWMALSTVAPLIAPLIIALRNRVMLAFLYTILLTLSLTIKRIPDVIKKFEDSHKNQH